MAENKTKITEASAQALIDDLQQPQKKEDAQTLLHMMREISGVKEKVWGTSLIGFGEYHYKYESGREGDSFRLGFSPRKQNISIYIMPGFSNYTDLLEKLGKHKLGKSCLYINRLEQVDLQVLRELMQRSLADMKKKYGE